MDDGGIVFIAEDEIRQVFGARLAGGVLPDMNLPAVVGGHTFEPFDPVVVESGEVTHEVVDVSAFEFKAKDKRGSPFWIAPVEKRTHVVCVGCVEDFEGNGGADIK